MTYPLRQMQCWNFLVVHAIKNVQVTDVHVLIMASNGLPCTDVRNCTDVCENKQDLTVEESDPEDEEDWLYGIFKTN